MFESLNPESGNPTNIELKTNEEGQRYRVQDPATGIYYGGDYVEKLPEEIDLTIEATEAGDNDGAAEAGDNNDNDLPPAPEEAYRVV